MTRAWPKGAREPIIATLGTLGKTAESVNKKPSSVTACQNGPTLRDAAGILAQ
ncbi:hypothetical protein [Saccharothrix sp. ST-888]|uniref:hypothetical protein n=1 Tax=Saccharothrix sp. ST-888 TaxID=1427391 RepID=UPI0012E0AD54|nr:hypothetical protein [Saccharothrix sp. ST-888]